MSAMSTRGSHRCLFSFYCNPFNETIYLLWVHLCQCQCFLNFKPKQKWQSWGVAASSQRRLYCLDTDASLVVRFVQILCTPLDLLWPTRNGRSSKILPEGIIVYCHEETFSATRRCSVFARVLPTLELPHRNWRTMSSIVSGRADSAQYECPNGWMMGGQCFLGLLCSIGMSRIVSEQA